MGHDHPSCAHCGERLGVYEPICAEYADSTVAEASMLTLAKDRRPTRLWHPACGSAATRTAA